MEDSIKAQVEAGRHAGDGEYFRDLIRRDQERRLAETELRRLIQEGLDSGINDRTVPDIMRDVKARLAADGKIPPHE